MRILTVEDDELLAQRVADVLTKQHYAVDLAFDGEAGWQFATTTLYDLILLDVMLPKLDGISLCRQLRQEGCQVPILLLTAKDSSTDKVMGLDAGADDYLIKPFEFEELMARIRAVLRRGNATSSPRLTWASLSLDPGSLEVTYDGHPLHLTATEYRLLELFLRNPQRVFSRNAIVEHLWAFDDQPEASTVKTYIKNLRQKLKAIGAPPDVIETVYGLGYRLKPEDTASEADLMLSGLPSSGIEQLKEQQAILAINRARDSFKLKIRDRLSVLKQDVKAMEVGNLSAELYEQAVYEAHRFTGTLGSLGYAAASQISESIEDLLQLQPSPERMQQLRKLVDELTQELSFTTDAIASVYPQLLIVSKDRSWVEYLQKTGSIQPIVIKAITVAEGNEWVKQTLHLIQIEQPQVVLLDLDAAPISQLMCLLGELSKHLPIPFLTITSSDNFDCRVEVARHGGNQFLLKTTPANSVLEQVLQTVPDVQLKDARILVVEGDRQTQEMIRASLEPYDLQLQFLADPLCFWQVLTTFSPDLLILGVQIPQYSSIDLCRVVRTDLQWSDLPILFLTSVSDVETLYQLLMIGADDCILKPVASAKGFTRILNRLIRGHKSQRM